MLRIATRHLFPPLATSSGKFLPRRRERPARFRRKGPTRRKVRRRGSHRAARRHGATDQEIHDTVPITAAFCMFNRYVDGLGTWAPRDSEVYDSIGAQLAAEGYPT